MSSEESAIGSDIKRGLGGAVVTGGTIIIGQMPYDGPESVIAPIAGIVDTALTVTGVGGGLIMAAAVAHGIYSTTRAAQRRKLFHAPGWAGRHAFADRIGVRAARRRGKQTRPGLDTRAARRAAPDTDFGQYLGRAVTGNYPVRGSKVLVDFETSLLVIAPPGAGKTGLTLHSLMDAPGSVLATSTKPDIFTLTAEIRAQFGPVYLFNPQLVGGIVGNFQWDPLTGCESYQVATDRATSLVRGTKAITAMQEASWGEKCIEILSRYLMAARLAQYDLRRVAYWLSNPDDEAAINILKAFPNYVPEGWAASLEAEMRSSAERMKGSIWSLARASVAFMSNPQIAVACTAGAGNSFDVRQFAESRGTLYLLGDKSDETIAPLLSALTDYVYRDVKALAQQKPKERLDPPFGFFLDEVAKITPVPLDEWAADARAHGIYITAVVQSLAQIEQRWGREALAIIKSLFSKVILGGIQNLQEIQEFSNLIGDRPIKKTSKGTTVSASGVSHSSNDTPDKERIIQPTEIRSLPELHALVLIDKAPAVITKFTLGQIRAEAELARIRAGAHKQHGHQPVPERVA